MTLRFAVAASNQTINPFAEALLKDFRSQRTQDSANHVTRWNTIRQIQNLRQLFFEVHGLAMNRSRSVSASKDCHDADRHYADKRMLPIHL
jgi:hypothetical protein